MKITADWKDAEGKGLKDIGWALEYEGTIESEEAIEIDIGHKWFKISGSLKSMFSISAGDGISAGLSITCKKVLKWSMNLFAGTAVYKKPTEEESVVEARELQGGEVKHGIVRLLPMESSEPVKETS